MLMVMNCNKYTLFQKQTVAYLFGKYLAPYGTRMSIAVCKTARRKTLRESDDSSHHHLCNIHFYIILQSMTRCP